MLKSAGYDGTPVVILQPTDLPSFSAWSLITADKLRAIGMKVSLQSMDWATLASRRAKRDPVAAGGWNLFHTHLLAVDVMDPAATMYSGDPKKGFFGWPSDEELEKLRVAFVKAKSLDEKREIAGNVQERLWAIGAQAQTGQYFAPAAYRKNVKGVISSPARVYWNISVE